MNYALILAGGTGTRAGGPLPKQFQIAGGKRILWRSVEAFLKFDPACEIVLVVHPDFLRDWDSIFGDEEKTLPHKIHKVKGGASRIQSVRNGLDFIFKVASGETKVFIHDSARPLVTPELIKRGAEVLRPGEGAVPVVPITDSIRKLTAGSSIAVRREDYVAVQTPQIFYLPDIYKAYSALEDETGLTDDASVAEKSGLNIVTFPGDAANIKITNPSDFRLLE